MGTPLAGLSSGRGGRSGPRPPRPSLPFPGHVPLPRVPGGLRTWPRRGGGGLGGVPGLQAGSQRSAAAPDQWLWASRGSSRGYAVVSLPGWVWQRIPAVGKEPERGMFSAPSVPNFLEEPVASRRAPRREPSRRAFRRGAGVPRGGKAPPGAAQVGSPARSRRGSRCPGRGDGSQPGSPRRRSLHRPAGGSGGERCPRPPPRAGSAGPLLARCVRLLREK